MELSHEYGVTTATIYNWLKQYSIVKVDKDKEITAKDYKAMKKCITDIIQIHHLYIVEKAIPIIMPV